VTIRYLLDTNIVSSFIRYPVGSVSAHIDRHGSDTVAVNAIVAGELYFGAIKNPDPRLIDRIDVVLASIAGVAIEAPTDYFYGAVRADLERKGTPIGSNDLWIAAHALALGVTIVTANISEFSRVEGLRVENWLEA
jgi:tRNA(fMet)-specific endonuclease VapC